MDTDTLLSINEAAKIAGCKAQKIHRAIRDHSLPATRVGWNWVIKRADLESFLQKGE